MQPGDDDQDPGVGTDSLADGLDETVVHGAFSTSTDPYGDALGDDTYGDDSDGDGDDGGDGVTSAGDAYGDASEEEGDDAGYGNGSDDAGDGDDDGSILGGDGGDGGDGGLDSTAPTLDDLDLTVHHASPLEGIGYLVDQIGEALFGDGGDEDAVAAAAATTPFDADPADVSSDSDLDLTGDGVVDRADLHEVRSVFEFRPGEGHHGGHEGA